MTHSIRRSLAKILTVSLSGNFDWFTVCEEDDTNVSPQSLTLCIYLSHDISTASDDVGTSKYQRCFVLPTHQDGDRTRRVTKVFQVNDHHRLSMSASHTTTTEAKGFLRDHVRFDSATFALLRTPPWSHCRALVGISWRFAWELGRRKRCTKRSSQTAHGASIHNRFPMLGNGVRTL